jgi:hypothetical protein
MTTIQEGIKHLIPQPFQVYARKSWYSLMQAAQWPLATFHPWRLTSQRRMQEYKNIHRGQRGFIIGNGPSLQKTDLSLLKNEITFGVNRIYLLFPELGFTTSYYLSINDLVIEQCQDDVLALPMPKFLSWHSRSYFHQIHQLSDQLTKDNSLMFLHTTYSGPRFARDIRGRLWEGATVTYVALQVAFFMGINPVILIGVDHNFSTKGKPNSTVTSQGEDPDHFAGNYFGKGFRWQLPDLETSEKAYLMAYEHYTLDHREILDATIGGKLSVFPKVDYNSLFS